MDNSEKKPSPLRIIFMGSPDFAVPSLKAIADSDHELVSVISGTDKKRGRGNTLTPTPVKKVAVDLGVPVIEADKMKDPDLHKKIAALEPDLIVIVAFKILPTEILSIPKIGAINLHASLLPKYRGAAPIHWAVINGEKETGNTVFFLDQHVDTGNILLQKKIQIGKNETTGEVYQRLMEMGGENIAEALHLISSGEYTLSPQSDAKATPAPKIFPEDCIIDPKKSSTEIHNFVRGMSPFPGAWFLVDQLKFKVYKTELIDEAPKIPEGELKINDKKLFLGCKNGSISLKEVQLHGRKRMSGIDFINGYNGAVQTEFDT